MSHVHRWNSSVSRRCCSNSAHDRIHHGLWAQMDATHHAHVPNNPYLHAIRDYYVHTLYANTHARHTDLTTGAQV